MNRREILKNLVLGSGAVVALPSWANGWSANSIEFSDVFTKNQSSTIKSIVGTFIPEGKTEPGAIGLEVDKFIDKLIADCYEKEDQDKVEAGIQALNESSQSTYKKSFELCTQGQRESLLMGFLEPSDENKKWFYNIMRRETIRGYTSSEYVMVNHYNYVMAPGFYKGCVDVAEV
jgi:hypothetical protein